jgi:hypothetical protein
VPETLKEGPNLYVYVSNNSVNVIDYLGLIGIKKEAKGGKGSSNCLGGAMSGENDEYAYPDNSKEPKDSFIDAMKKESWGCKEVKSVDECKCECDEDKILITLYKNKNKENKGKNPWTDPTFRHGKGKTGRTDIHAVRADSGCSNHYTQISHYEPNPQKRDDNIDWDLFKGTHLLCCCEKKISKRCKH